MVPTGTEICTIPCAGVRIASGKLLGLMGWRLVVELDDENPEEDAKGRQGSTWLRKRKEKGKFKENRLSVVSNFILDTGSSKSVVAQEMLRALGYQGRYNRASYVFILSKLISYAILSFIAGAGVNLRIQGIRAQCTVAHLGEASKLGSQFMTSGNLTFYFDSKLNAPVLYGEHLYLRLEKTYTDVVSQSGTTEENVQQISRGRSCHLYSAAGPGRIV